MQIAASIPNFAIQEYPLGELEPPKSEIVNKPLELEEGFLVIPDAPGIGIEIVEGAEEMFPARKREVNTRLHKDGSVFDQ